MPLPWAGVATERTSIFRGRHDARRAPRSVASAAQPRLQFRDLAAKVLVLGRELGDAILQRLHLGRGTSGWPRPAASSWTRAPAWPPASVRPCRRLAAATCSSNGRPATAAAAFREIVPARTAATSSGAACFRIFSIIVTWRRASACAARATASRDFSGGSAARRPGRRRGATRVRPRPAPRRAGGRPSLRRLADRLALGDDLLLAQRQHAALEVGDAAPAQMLVDHPQVDVLDRPEARVLDRC